MGYLAQTQSAHQGLTAVLWKYVTENGETTKEQVNSSTYQAVPVSYDVGVSTDDPTIAAAIQTAVANNDLEQVQAIINGSYGSGQESESDSQESEGQQGDSSSQQQSETQPANEDGNQQQSESQQTQQPDADIPDHDEEPEVIQ